MLRYQISHFDIILQVGILHMKKLVHKKLVIFQSQELKVLVYIPKQK